MSQPAVAYNRSEALLRLRESDTRRKGSQSGSVRFKSGAWYVRFNEWRFVDGAWKFYDDPKQAAAAYDQEAKVLHGEHARVNF